MSKWSIEFILSGGVDLMREECEIWVLWKCMELSDAVCCLEVKMRGWKMENFVTHVLCDGNKLAGKATTFHLVVASSCQWLKPCNWEIQCSWGKISEWAWSGSYERGRWIGPVVLNMWSLSVSCPCDICFIWYKLGGLQVKMKGWKMGCSVT